MELVAGIHKIDGIRGVNCYLVVNPGKLIIIDTGVPGKAQIILNYVKRQGYHPSDVKYIFLTHADIDHVGCARELRELTGARVAIHDQDIPVLTGKQKFKTINNFLSPAVGLLMNLMHFEPLEPDIVFKDGSQIEGWQIIYTPGHTPGSVCIFRPGKIIFTGDVLRTSSRGKPRPISRRICADLELARKSLITLASLNYEVLLPGHGAPITKGASGKVQEMVKRYNRGVGKTGACH
jgi:hydroxyacylglutathione hydrolase